MKDTRNLGKIDLNKECAKPEITTMWCRIACDGKNGQNYNEQTHSFFELHLCTEGKCEIDVGGEVCKLTKGKYVLIPPIVRHRILSVSEDFTKLVWGFSILSDELCGRVSSEPYKVREVPQCALVALELMLGEAEDPSGFQAVSIIRDQLFYILILLVRDITGIRADVRSVKEPRALMREMRRYVSENLSARVGLKDVSKWLYVSERHIERLCLSEYSVSFGEMKRSIQHERIRALLSGTDYSLSEIAACAGFADEYSMSKFFKRREGVSPARYRRQSKT
ncbi:MAG: helix-turn-helix transcriptional regulator [Clostridia bacterium]|nr:helix-turn-helix transcriptional regulator [Clostridia bacterium]